MARSGIGSNRPRPSDGVQGLHPRERRSGHISLASVRPGPQVRQSVRLGLAGRRAGVQGGARAGRHGGWDSRMPDSTGGGTHWRGLEGHRGIMPISADASR